MKYISFIVALASLFFASCSSSKHITSTKETVDSTIYHQRDSIVAEKSSLQIRYDKLLKDSKKTNIVFRDRPCPQPVNIGGDCKYDSLVAAIQERDAYIDNMKNVIKVNKDGSYTVEGQLKEAYIDLETMDRTITDMSENNEKLTNLNDSLSAELTKVKSVKEKDKSSGLSLWWLLLIPIAFFTGKYWKQIIALKNKFV